MLPDVKCANLTFVVDGHNILRLTDSGSLVCLPKPIDAVDLNRKYAVPSLPFGDAQNYRGVRFGHEFEHRDAKDYLSQLTSISDTIRQ